MKKIFSLMLCAVAVAGHVSAAANSKLSPDARIRLSLSTQSANTADMVRVLVQWSTPVGSATADKIANLGGQVISEMSSVNMGIYMVPASALPTLDADAAAKYVSLDRKLHRKLALAAAAINAPTVWKAGYVGTGIGVAIIDSGVNVAANLGRMMSNIVYTEDFITPSGLGSPGYGVDWYGHGQHIAGIIASNAKESSCSHCKEKLIGIAPGAKIINLKVLDTNGEGSDSAVIAAIDRAIALKSLLNIRVINLSLGRPVYESYLVDPLCQAVEAAWRAGIVVVVAAGNDGRDNSFGNDGYGTITAPGNDPYVITVGSMKTEGTATRDDDLIASYSSKGPTAIDHIVKPDIVAPGNQIVSLLAKHGTLAMLNPQNLAPLSVYEDSAPSLQPMPVQPAVPTNPDQEPGGVHVPGGYSKVYYVMSGTSMAAAVVSGAVADILHAAPALTPDQVKILLMQTASKSFPVSSSVTDPSSGQIYTSYYDLFTVGAGYIDLAAAMQAVSQVPSAGTALSPTATFDDTTGDVELTFDPGTVFASKVLWGTTSVWGNSEVSGTKVLWGSSSVWGAASGTDNSEKAIWGSKAIWSAKGIWSSSDVNTSESILIGGEY